MNIFSTDVWMLLWYSVPNKQGHKIVSKSILNQDTAPLFFYFFSEEFSDTEWVTRTCAVSGWQTPWRQRIFRQAWQPGTTPVFMWLRVKSCSSWLMYRFLMQPWKLDMLTVWEEAPTDEGSTSSGIPEREEEEEEAAATVVKTWKFLYLGFYKDWIKKRFKCWSQN